MQTFEDNRANSTASLRELLLKEFGPVMNTEGLCRVLHYPSPGAFRRSHERGRLPVPVFAFPGRRGLFALTSAVAQVLEALSSERPDVHLVSRLECPKDAGATKSRDSCPPGTKGRTTM